MWGGFNPAAFINAKAQTASAVSALTNQINASSSSNPLWIIGAGPMEVIGRALQASDPSKTSIRDCCFTFGMERLPR